jgi:hypothetical protein
MENTWMDTKEIETGLMFLNEIKNNKSEFNKTRDKYNLSDDWNETNVYSVFPRITNGDNYCNYLPKDGKLKEVHIRSVIAAIVFDREKKIEMKKIEAEKKLDEEYKKQKEIEYEKRKKIQDKKIKEDRIKNRKRRNILKTYDDSELVSELQNRGYKGSLELIIRKKYFDLK